MNADCSLLRYVEAMRKTLIDRPSSRPSSVRETDFIISELERWQMGSIGHAYRLLCRCLYVQPQPDWRSHCLAIGIDAIRRVVDIGLIMSYLEKRVPAASWRNRFITVCRRFGETPVDDWRSHLHRIGMERLKSI